MVSNTIETDEQLALGVAQADQRAFAELVGRHTSRFYAIAYRFLLQKEDAEDIVQQAFLKLWQGKARFEQGKNAKFTTWFHRIVYNACIDLVRSQKGKVIALEVDIVDGRENAESELVSQEQGKWLHDTLQQLPERQRAALTYAYIEGMKQQDVADIMHLSLKAVESLLSRGKASLKKKIEHYAIAG